MTIPQPIAFFPAAADHAAGKDTPRDFLERCLARLEEFEPAVGAFVCHDIAAARTAADRSTERWRGGRPLSPIDGMPLGIKDIIETVDMPTEQGSPLFVGCRTGRDAASVAALREAGAVILGKVVTTEFAATEPRGTRNPWDSERTPGGSSSGSAAAVACGIVPAALGTQVVGSILRPASFCGCVGFKPSVGGINRGGSYDYSKVAPACLPPRSKTPGSSRSTFRRGPAAIRAIPGCKARPTRRRRTAPGLSPCCKRPAGKSPRQKPGAPSMRRWRGSPAPVSRSQTAMPILRSKRSRTRSPTRQG
jgi:hypothetical protein